MKPVGWVVVSGAAGALGRSITAHYVDAGASVLALDRDVEALSGLAGATTRAVDLSDEAAIDDALSAVRPSEPISLLVNAVGLIWSEPVLTLRGAKLQPHEAETWRRAIEVNLTVPFLVASRVAARMARRGGGAIVNFSSIAAAGNAGQAAYAAAKAGVEGMTHAMAAELGPLGIRVNAVAPGFIDVPSTTSALTRNTLESYAARAPARRLGTIGELIDAIVFLADNGFANGAVLALDGGLRL